MNQTFRLKARIHSLKKSVYKEQIEVKMRMNEKIGKRGRKRKRGKKKKKREEGKNRTHGRVEPSACIRGRDSRVYLSQKYFIVVQGSE